MNNINFYKLFSTSPILAFLLVSILCIPSLLKADDTEVFYSKGIKDNNVLFIMDNSGSMTTIVDGTTADGDTTIVTRVIATGSDDAEENVSGTTTTKTLSGDLELGEDSSPQRVGLRFRLVTIPKDATITSAYIQFTSDSDLADTSTNTSTLDIQIESSDSPTSFVEGEISNIGNRSLYTDTVPWNPITGSGKRSAISYNDNDGEGSPLLMIEYENTGEKTRMQVMKGALRTVLQNAPDNLSVGIMNYGDTIGNREDLPNGVKFPISSVNSMARPIVEEGMTIDGIPRWDLSNIPEPQEGTSVRTFLSQIIDDWKPTGYTPIVDSLYEAARYFRGEQIHFGFGIADKNIKYPAHPSTYVGEPITSTIDVGSCSGEPNIVKIWGNANIESWNNGTDTGGYICPSDRLNPSGPGLLWVNVLTLKIMITKTETLQIVK